MKKLLLLVLLLLGGVVLVGCARKEGIPYIYQSPPTNYWTLHEAYEMVQPAMLEWNEDAFVVRVAVPLGDSRPEWGLQDDGKVPRWRFTVVSPSAQKYTAVLLVNEITSIGIDGHPERDSSNSGVPLPIDHFMSSDTILLIASEATGGLKPSVLFTDQAASSTSDDEDGASWIWYLSYDRPEGGTAKVYINAITGEVMRNDFLPQ